MQADFEAEGATLLALSPALSEYLRAFKEEKRLGFDLLHDPSGAVANDYGLSHSLPTDLQAIYARFGVDLPTLNGDGVWRLPLPARYIVDTDGRIRYARVHADYTTRPEPSETLAALGALGGA